MPDPIAPWLATMRDITGTLETPGNATNPVILAWRDEIKSRFPDMASYCDLYKDDGTPWCGLTVAYCMAHNGIRPVFGATEDDRFLFAMAWKQFGVPAQQPQLGDVLVFNHHVTLYDGEEGDFYRCRGGNQSDSVNVTRFRKASCLAIRRPPAAALTGLPPTAPVPISSEKRFAAITATVFGGAADFERGAYDGHIITDNELGVALPCRIPSPRPKVRVFNTSTGKSVVCDIVDIGPWNTTDPYWETGSRPQAESGIDRQGRPTNKAGIDLTPAAALAIGIDGKGQVDWEFATAEIVKSGGSQMGNSIAEIVTVLEKVLPLLQAMNTQQNAPAGSATPAPSSGTVQSADLQKIFDIIKAFTGDTPAPLGTVNGALGDTIGKLLDGKKTAIGMIGSLVTAVLPHLPGVSGALSGALGLAATPVAPVMLPIFLAMGAWGVLGKLEKWSGNKPTS